MKSFSAVISNWYEKNKRELPWRETKDPYKIWLSEVILQQTRVEQGTSYYLKFITEFPTVKHLAAASEDEVLKLWQGLGYYSRARNLHAAARQITLQSKKAIFPASYTEIIKLKGAGTYTASAISSICFNEPRAVVDGNVYRVLSRIFGIKTPIDSGKGKQEFQELADALLDKKNPGRYNQAVMEFGALHCTPRNPNCTSCPFEQNCFAHAKKMVNELPVKERKTKTRTRYFYYLVCTHGNKTFLKKRTNAKDIWQNLYEFPLLETLKPQSDKKIIAEILKEFGLKGKQYAVRSISPGYKHVLSHQVLQAKFVNIELTKVPAVLKKKFICVNRKAAHTYALPRLIEKFVESETFN